MGRETCRWVADRLALLAGGELLGLERRRVERHVLGCPSCRDRLDRLRDALATLHTASQFDPVPADAPSLWPALARQIQESRRNPSPQRVRLRLRTWVRLGLAATVLAAASGLGVWALSQKYDVTVRVDVKPKNPMPAVRHHESRFANGTNRPTPIRRSSQRTLIEEPPSVSASDEHTPESSPETLADVSATLYDTRPPAEPTN